MILTLAILHNNINLSYFNPLERVEMFCDIFGNCNIREITADFISMVSKEL